MKPDDTVRCQLGEFSANADEAICEAKHHGRDRYVMTEGKAA